MAEYTENNLDGQRLASVYTKISRGQHAGAPGNAGAPPKEPGAAAAERGGSGGLSSPASAKAEPTPAEDDDKGWQPSGEAEDEDGYDD